MKIKLVFVALFLGACSFSDEIIYKEGSSIAEYEKDLLNCKVEGLNRIPRIIITKKKALEQVPGKVRCVETVDEDTQEIISECTTTSTGFEGGEETSKDINEQLRQEFVQGCVSQKGYSTVVLPVCKKPVKQKFSRKLNPRTALEPLMNKSCIISNNDDSGWIINP